jgi:uncharacterized coiled-coil protein SlyX
MELLLEELEKLQKQIAEMQEKLSVQATIITELRAKLSEQKDLPTVEQ